MLDFTYVLHKIINRFYKYIRYNPLTLSLTLKLEIMSVLKVIELLANSNVGWEDAAHKP
jgi:hypothetical protein